ncbi:hypothetical protein OG921_17030 [Aldersonia sp. NBC_00410]|uniref:hypothetical protein n=1 Tax=Aldersonia sp. NBC_00410 TaxID=2975954 RepID=UPI00225A21BD|nr:hypothetical protein [Aldersonia sp. NBC_00410]MCX5044873.1 hypothetical protein [Aldersonia sp. NBC_00410]
MPAQTIELATARLVRRSGASRSAHRLDVIGHDVAEVISAAGGTLFDRALGGWDVCVYATDGGDSRALRILGLTGLPLEEGISSAKAGPRALAVSAAALATDERVRDYLSAVLECGDVEVTIFGEGLPSMTTASGPARRRMSLAARAFKGYALDAAAIPHGEIEREEYFGAECIGF